MSKSVESESTGKQPLLGAEGPFSGEGSGQGRITRGHTKPLGASELFHMLRADPNNHAYSDLILASRSGDRQTVENVLNLGVDVNGDTESGTTALIESLIYDHFEVALLLINKGADVRARSRADWTPLHFVASHGPEALASEILDRGGDVDAQTDQGMTPLMIAARRGRFRMVKLLLDKSADVNAVDASGANALIHAANGDEDESGGDPLTVEVLVAAGASANVQDNTGSSPLMAVSFYGDLSSVLLFLRSGADVNVRDLRGRTALTIAEYAHRSEIVETLRAAGATR